ncbi:DUF3473 domain-containing protein [Polynucleobacter paneuropaeus]|jgi:polysaccharide deacetylase family protein (PEP-CTERM system associated)|nr:DUF3473 domain-containing protein [Polynucleobacter paneuropaeus]MBT8610785.1 DUF3473 domain-containing protein [Polynucleobacter paneuropaeus]
MDNILTFDIEDWFQVFYGESIIKKSDWDSHPGRIHKMLDEILTLLESENIKATFFVVGWLAKKYPHLIQKIHILGHEVASHGYWHTPAYNQTTQEYLKDVKDSKSAIEDAIGDEIIGYRAPGFSISEKMGWALETLSEVGYKYDSSLLHIKSGIQNLEYNLIEIPPNSLKLNNLYYPINGGFIFRLTPYFLYNMYIKNLNSRGKPLIFYTHSWEILNLHDKLKIKGYKKIIQYININSVPKKIKKLVSEYSFLSCKDYLTKNKIMT